MTPRIFNFSAGPCTLPLEVLEEAQAELLDYHGMGMSIMEISHRTRFFEPVLYETLDLAKRLIGAPECFTPLLLSGGASVQFAMSAMHLLDENDEAAIINSGVWANKAWLEGNRIAIMHNIWNGADHQFLTLPNDEALTIPKNARYLHVTSNETVDGLQFPQLPKVDVPLVVDVSSDFYTRAIDWDRCALVYGGVQKNLAPSGLSLAFIHQDFLPPKRKRLPNIFNYQEIAKMDSMYNTPPTWQIYMLNLGLKWLEKNGGIPHFHALANKRSAKLYQAIDSTDFYQNTIDKRYRSTMNVVFKTPSDALDTRFWQEAEQQGLYALKGHKLVGGIRASIYNALPDSAVDALIAFMTDFANENKI